MPYNSRSANFDSDPFMISGPSKATPHFHDDLVLRGFPRHIK